MSRAPLEEGPVHRLSKSSAQGLRASQPGPGWSKLPTMAGFKKCMRSRVKRDLCFLQGLQAVTACQRGFTDCSKRAPLGVGGRLCLCEQEACGKFLYLPLNSATPQ